MCGGVREFESMRSPAAAKLLSQEMKQYGYGYSEELYDADFSCYPPAVDAWNPYPVKPKNRFEVEAAPTGLALAASVGDKEFSQSPARKSVPRTLSVNPGFSSSTNQEIKPCVPQDLSAIPARADHATNAMKATVAASGTALGHGRACSIPIPRKCTDEKPKEKSIFCSAFSPPDDYITEVQEAPSADFMGACFYCGLRLGSGTDIYMYRGDRAFCSDECRYDHILEEELSERVRHQKAVASKGEPDHCTAAQRIAVPTPVISVLG